MRGKSLQMEQGKSHMTINTGGGAPVITKGALFMIGGAQVKTGGTPVITKGTQAMTGGALMIKNTTLGEALLAETDMTTNLDLAVE